MSLGLITVIQGQLRALRLLYLRAVRKRRTGFDLLDRADAQRPRVSGAAALSIILMRDLVK
jgi:hypothetical protein